MAASFKEQVKQFCLDVVRLRRIAKYPPSHASSRRALERECSYSRSGTLKGHKVTLSLDTSVSCNWVRHSAKVTIDGKAVRQYIPALRSLIGYSGGLF